MFPTQLPQIRSSHSRRRTVVLLLVGVLAGVTVGGSVGVIAASSAKTVTVCAKKKTNVLRYAANGKCTKKETLVLLNQTGTNGTDGTDGADGVDGADGADGADGVDGSDGTDGTDGARGPAGTPGTNGAVGPAGTPGTNGAVGPAGSSFTARSVCGANGTTLCAVGVQGPGGGTVFYVDTEGRYSDFDYLEVAPTDASAGSAWSNTSPRCGLAQNQSCQTNFLTTSGEALNFLAIGTGRAATAAIVLRNSDGTTVADYAAGVADLYFTPTASDWFLPSRDELNEVCKYARNTGQAAGATTTCSGGTLRSGFASGLYWSSSEYAALPVAWYQDFNAQVFTQGIYSKTAAIYVRPVRSF